MYDYKNIKISVDEKGVAQMVLARTEKANTFDVKLSFCLAKASYFLVVRTSTGWHPQ